MSTFSDNLRQHRKDRGKSMQDVATALNTRVKQISRWETGESAPSIENAILLAKTLGASLDELCGLDVKGKQVLDIGGLSKKQQEVIRELVGCF